jgi:hypothetical protein
MSYDRNLCLQHRSVLQPAFDGAARSLPPEREGNLASHRGQRAVGVLTEILVTRRVEQAEGEAFVLEAP